MPKRVGFLYDKLLDKEFIKKCIIKGAKKKSKRWDVAFVKADIDFYVDKMYNIVKNHDYTPTQPKIKTINDISSQKVREIAVQPFFPDGVMQQMIVAAMQDVLMRGMHHWSCASIPDRGGKHALKIAKRAVQKRRKNSKYIAELDIKKFYPSTPQRGVIKALERKIKDKDFLQLIAVTISCYPEGLRYAYDLGMPADVIVGDKVGLCIGFYVNQWLENYYLESLDTFALQQDGVSFEYRYMDNIQMFGRNKKKLHKAVRAINEYLQREKGVKLKENWQVYKMTDKERSRKLSTVGYRVGRNYTIVRKRNFLRFTRQCRRAKKLKSQRKPIPVSMAQGLISRAGQYKWCNGRKVLEKYFFPIGVRRLKNIIREDARRRNALQKGAVTV